MQQSMQDSGELPNGTELGVFFIFQNCHLIAASNLSYFCRAEPQRGLETGFLFNFGRKAAAQTIRQNLWPCLIL